MRRSSLALFALFAGLAAGSPALAQQTARQMLVESMQQRGFYSGVSYQSRELPVYESGIEEWRGLQVSEAMAHGGGNGTYLAILRNTTGSSYCVRLKSVETTDGAITGKMQGNVLVEPYQSTVLIAANANNVNTTISVAFWPPDHSLERICSDAAPEGLERWASNGALNHFWGSRRE